MDDQPHHLSIAVAARSHPSYDISGDGWHICHRAGSSRIALIDGLGHGPEAAVAAARANEVLEVAPHLAPAAALQCCHDALGSTRGAAMAVATVGYDAPSVIFAGVGNVEAQVWNGQRVRRPIAQRGIVGRALPTPREEVVPVESDDWLLLLYSDGIRDRFALEFLPEFIARDGQGLAEHLLAEWSRESDDATVIVVMSRPISVR